ncbi:hypothetical protein IG631_22437 [Alternaria alternata]|nr:hypothetical protein IG631_22437 [Alternaria alternata]
MQGSLWPVTRPSAESSNVRPSQHGGRPRLCSSSDAAPTAEQILLSRSTRICEETIQSAACLVRLRSGKGIAVHTVPSLASLDPSHEAISPLFSTEGFPFS